MFKFKLVHLPVNSLTSAFVCLMFMQSIIKTQNVIHDCVDVESCGTWPLLDGLPILDQPNFDSYNISIFFYFSL